MEEEAPALNSNIQECEPDAERTEPQLPPLALTGWKYFPTECQDGLGRLTAILEERNTNVLLPFNPRLHEALHFTLNPQLSVCLFHMRLNMSQIMILREINECYVDAWVSIFTLC